MDNRSELIPLQTNSNIFVNKMKQLMCIFAFALFLVKFSNATPLSLTLYHNTNYRGENVEFFNTHTNALCVNTLIGSVNSECSTGYWIYSESDATYSTIGLNENQTCSRFSSSRSVTAVRRLGPADTTDKAIVFYSGTGVTDYLINEKLANANVTIPMSLAAASIITYGGSSWTLFEDKNFDGKTVCLETGTTHVTRLSRMYDPHVNLAKVGSLIKGCDVSHELLVELRRSVRL